jgi:hypothetical protein
MRLAKQWIGADLLTQQLLQLSILKRQMPQQSVLLLFFWFLNCFHISFY